MGPQLDGPGDGNSGFVAVGGGGALGYMGELGIAETSMRRSMGDGNGRASRATRASYSPDRRWNARRGWTAPRARVRAPRRGVRRPSTPSAARAGRPSRPRRGEAGVYRRRRRRGFARRSGHQSRPYHSGGDAFDDDDDDDDLVRAGVGTEADDAPAFPAMRKEGFFGEDGEEISADDLAMHGTTTNASKALDAVYKKNEARMRALGLAEDGAGFNDQGPGGLDPV